MWIIIAMVALAAWFWYMGWRWESSVKRPKLRETPLVSILIPAYNSDKTIENTIKSIKNIDYPKKEIIVVNDSDDDTPNICKRLGVKCIQSKKRNGKAYSLNQAVKKTKGKILFFVDSDTTVKEDALKKMVPWFSNSNIGAVAPKFGVQNKTNLLTRMISLEHQIESSLFKVHMFFGSMIAFRGCGITIRRTTFEKLGGWPYTLIEDTDLGARMVSSGIKIHYEPEAYVSTIEPETVRELKSQRKRWGKGTIYSFINHRKFYKKNSQFILYFIPYILLAIGVIGFLTWQTLLYFIPLISLYLFYTAGLQEIALLLILLTLPIFSNTFTAVTAAATSHIAIMTYGEKRKTEWIYIIPYIFIYLPITLTFYIYGIISGIRDKRAGKKEIDFKDW